MELINTLPLIEEEEMCKEFKIIQDLPLLAKERVFQEYENITKYKIIKCSQMNPKKIMKILGIDHSVDNKYYSDLRLIIKLSKVKIVSLIILDNNRIICTYESNSVILIFSIDGEIIKEFSNIFRDDYSIDIVKPKTVYVWLKNINSSLVVISQHNRIEILDIVNDVCVQTKFKFIGHTNKIVDIVQLTNNRIASLEKFDRIIIWDINDGNSLHRLDFRMYLISQLSCLNGSLVYVYESKSIIICNKSDYIKSIEFKINSDNSDNSDKIIMCLLVYDENIIITSTRSCRLYPPCYNNSDINFWNVNKQECYKTFKVEIDVRSLVKLCDDKFASLHSNILTDVNNIDRIMIWSIHSDICIKTLNMFLESNILRSINGNLLHVSRTHKINIWNTNYKLNLILEIPRLKN